MNDLDRTSRWFAVCVPGCERVLLEEIRCILGDACKPFVLVGGVEFEGPVEIGWRANLFLRSANRILFRFGRFYATGFAELIRKAERLPWNRILPPNRPIAFRVSATQSRLYHSDAIAERLYQAITHRLGDTPPLTRFHEEADDPPQLIVVRLWHDHVIISLDTSGAALHRRGYRQDPAHAPLREDLAAAILLASGWDCRSPLVDPFCGSGTIAIEAAWMACGIPPGHHRRFSFMNWPGFDQEAFERLRHGWETKQDLPEIIAADRDPVALGAAADNAARAGVADRIRFVSASFGELPKPPSPGWIVTNPPYGRRVPLERGFYRRLGRVFRSWEGWHRLFLLPNPVAFQKAGIPCERVLSFDHGGIRVTLTRFISEGEEAQKGQGEEPEHAGVSTGGTD